MGQTPDQVLNPSDPGDDTQDRYRYQAVRVCCHAIAIFDDSECVLEVYCEHREDVLIKYVSGRYRGVQVKTRNDGSEPFKAIDEEMLNAIRRFIEEEKSFPGQYDGFTLESNCGFWKEKKNGSNLDHIIKEAAGKDLDSIPEVVRTFLKKLCPNPKPAKPAEPKRKKKTAANAGEPDPSRDEAIPPPEPHEAQLKRALAVLHKVRLTPTPPKTDAVHQLVHALGKCPAVGAKHRLCDLKRIADALVNEVLEASSKQHGSAKAQYLGIIQDPQQEEIASLIKLKRLDRARIEAIIRAALTFNASSSSTEFSVTQLPTETRVQQTKLTAGGMTIDEVNEAVLQRQAAEYAIAQWIEKDGVPDANAKYSNVLSAVLTQCNEAAASSTSAGSIDGQAMLKAVKDKIKALHASDGKSLHELRYDQLLGMAGILTEACRLWWSKKFKLSQEDKA